MKRIPPPLAGLVATVLAYLFGYQGYVAYNDSTAAAYPAWLLVHRGTVDVPQTPQALFWVREEFWNTGHGIYSNRPLGLILASLPGQLVPQQFSLSATNVSGAVVAGLVVYLLARLVNGDPLITVLAAFGTPVLYVGGRTLWPTMIGLACLLGALVLAASVSAAGTIRRPVRWAAGTFALVAFATMSRPPAGLLIVLVLLAEYWSPGLGVRRTAARCAPAAAGFLAGAAALALYAHAYFGTYSPAGAYPISHHLHLGALLLGVLSPARGMLFYTPWLLFVRPPDRRAAVVLGIAATYTVGIWLIYDAWGGDGFIGYRYGLPLAILAVRWVRLTSWPAKAAAAWSVAIGVVALTIGHRPVSAARVWSHSGFAWQVLVYTGVLAALLLAGAWWAGRRRALRGASSGDDLPATAAQPVAV